jgi:hypothetical protein
MEIYKMIIDQSLCSHQRTGLLTAKDENNPHF